jgi:hypothetical protein
MVVYFYFFIKIKNMWLKSDMNFNCYKAFFEVIL